MPLWKIYHPAGAYTAEDKKEFSQSITKLYTSIPIPAFYVVTIFQDVAKDSCFVGGESHNKFVRFKIDQIALAPHHRGQMGALVRDSSQGKTGNA
jgi:phenylpyruvate tautomerase PptA (4-oxalocrotonate tautomerase family)